MLFDKLLLATCSRNRVDLLDTAKAGCIGGHQSAASPEGCTLSFHLCVQPLPETRNGRQRDQCLHIWKLCEDPLRNLLDQKVAQVDPRQPTLGRGNGIEHGCIGLLGICDLNGSRLWLLWTWGHTALQSCET